MSSKTKVRSDLGRNLDQVDILKRGHVTRLEQHKIRNEIQYSGKYLFENRYPDLKTKFLGLLKLY